MKHISWNPFKRGPLPALLLPAWFGLALGQESPFSGPQPGEPLEPFAVLAVNGPDAGREVDLISRFGDSPVLLIFLHQLDRNVAALLQPCEDFAQDRAGAGLKTLIVYLAPDKIEGERRMLAVTKSLKLQSAVGVSLEGVEGPGAYGLNRQVAVTALVANQRRVTANFAIVQPGMVDAPKVLAEVARQVGGTVLTAEQMLAARGGYRAQTPAMSSMQGADPDETELGLLLRALVRPENDARQVDEAIRQLRSWIGEKESRRLLAVQKIDLILPGGQGSEYARKQLADLGRELGAGRR